MPSIHQRPSLIGARTRIPIISKAHNCSAGPDFILGRARYYAVRTGQILYMTIHQRFFVLLSDYDDCIEAKSLFMQLDSNLGEILLTPDGKIVTQKFSVLARTVKQGETFKDMVKIIWRMVRTIYGTSIYKLGLLFLGLSAMCCSLSKLQTSDLNSWIANLEEWLGNQLTIGGKGVAGEGEGTAEERINRFFSTPYLHDFD